MLGCVGKHKQRDSVSVDKQKHELGRFPHANEHRPTRAQWQDFITPARNARRSQTEINITLRLRQ